MGAGLILAYTPDSSSGFTIAMPTGTLMVIGGVPGGRPKSLLLVSLGG